MSERCPQLWRVEAARDGRLSAPSSTSTWKQHAATCPECKREQGYMDDLAEALREAAPSPDEVSGRRLRQHILELADGLLGAAGAAGKPAARRTRLTRIWFAGSVAVGLTVTGALYAHRQAATPAAKQRGVATVRAAGSGTTWVRHRTRNAEQIDLSDGILSLEVKRAPGDPRVVVRVPDGEIEDQGTAFKVRVQAGRTAEISVTQGWVVFRRRGYSEVRLPAGATWTPHEKSADIAAATSRAAIVDTHSLQTAGSASMLEQARRERRARRGHTEAAESAAPSTPTADLPSDDEDVSYLALLSLVRQGKAEPARIVATAYLKRFPNAFRRAEVARIADLVP